MSQLSRGIVSLEYSASVFRIHITSRSSQFCISQVPVIFASFWLPHTGHTHSAQPANNLVATELTPPARHSLSLKS